MNDKDLEVAKKYAEGELFKPTRIKQDSFEESFLAGIQYERSRQSEVVRMSFDEWFNKERRIFEANEPATFCDSDEFCMKKGWQAACEYKQKEIDGLKNITYWTVEQNGKVTRHISIAEIQELQAENKKLREALEFYALWSNWGGDLRAGNEIISDDCDYIEKWYEYVGGKRAREALKEVNEEL